MITVDTKVKDIANNAEAAKIVNDAMREITIRESGGTLENYTEDPRLALAYNMTLRALAGFPQSFITPEIFEQMEEAFEAAEIEDDDDDDDD